MFQGCLLVLAWRFSDPHNHRPSYALTVQKPVSAAKKTFQHAMGPWFACLMVLPNPQGWLHADLVLISWIMQPGSCSGLVPYWGPYGWVPGSGAPCNGFLNAKDGIPLACAYTLGLLMGSASGPWGYS